MTPAEAAMLAYLQKYYQGDAIFRPSNADRWLTCHGSAQLIARLPRIPQKGNIYTRPGTAAHQLAQTVLLDPQKLSTEDFVGRHIIINDDPTDSVFVDEEMGEKVGGYVDIIEAYRAMPGTEVYIEEKLTLQHLDPSDPLLNECRGTGDAVIINRLERWIVDLDLKYGIGVPVAGDSPQPKIYLLMALLTFFDGKPWKWGGTTIYQPRLPVPPYTEEDHYKAFIYMPAEIMGDFLGEVSEAMHAALGPDPKLVPSVKGCRWCEARPICPALRESGLTFGRALTWEQGPPQQTVSAMLQPFPKVSVATHEQPRPPTSNGNVVLPSPAELDPVEISNMLYGGHLFESWFEGVKHRAAQLLSSGVRIPPTPFGSPGYHLKPRTGNRRWNAPRETIEAELLKLNLKPTQIYTDPKLRSPKQVEDSLPKLLKGAIAPLVERPPGAPTLVPGNEPEEPKILPSLTKPFQSINQR